MNTNSLRLSHAPSFPLAQRLRPRRARPRLAAATATACWRSRSDLEPRHFDLLPKQPHFQPRAKAMISMFMQGGPSHIDLFDPKPELDKRDGQNFPGDVKYDDAAQRQHEGAREPVEVPEARPVRHGRERTAAALRRHRRRHDAHPRHADRREQSRPVHLRAAERAHPRRPADARELAHLRPRLARRRTCPPSSRSPIRAACRCSAWINWTNGWLPSLYQGTVVRPRSRAF